MQIEMIERPRARRRDPATSHDAAKRAERFARTHAGRILDAFKNDLHPDEWWSAADLARSSGLTVEQVCRRLPEIAALQVVTYNGQEVTKDGYRMWRLKANQ